MPVIEIPGEVYGVSGLTNLVGGPTATTTRDEATYVEVVEARGTANLTFPLPPMPLEAVTRVELVAKAYSTRLLAGGDLNMTVNAFGTAAWFYVFTLSEGVYTEQAIDLRASDWDVPFTPSSDSSFPANGNYFPELIPGSIDYEVANRQRIRVDYFALRITYGATRLAHCRIVQRGNDGLGITGGRRILGTKTLQSSNRATGIR